MESVHYLNFISLEIEDLYLLFQEVHLAKSVEVVVDNAEANQWYFDVSHVAMIYMYIPGF